MPYFEDKKSFRSWWQSRTGLEQKLVILATVLFILAFSLMISVIVIKNRSPAAPSVTTTISPVTGTGDTTPVTEEPSPSTSPNPTAEPTPSTSPNPTAEPSPSTNSTVEPTPSTNSTVEPTPSTSPPEKPTTPTSEASSTKSTISSSEATGSTETTTIVKEPPKENKSEAFAPGSINNRPARYISPRALA